MHVEVAHIFFVSASILYAVHVIIAPIHIIIAIGVIRASCMSCE